MILVMTFGQSLWLVEYNDDNPIAKALCKVGNISDFAQIMSANKYNEYNKLKTKKDYPMKVKDLPPNVRVIGAKVRTKNGVVGFVICEFPLGVMLSTYSLKQFEKLENEVDKRLYPQVLENKEDMKDWEIIADTTTACNCHILVDHKYTMNMANA